MAFVPGNPFSLPVADVIVMLDPESEEVHLAKLKTVYNNSNNELCVEVFWSLAIGGSTAVAKR